MAPGQASSNPKLILLFRAVGVKGTLTANLHGSHKAVTDKKLSMRIPVEIFYISFFYFLLPVLYFPWNACQCGLREISSSLQSGNNISEALSPHSALQSALSFSQVVTQKLLYLKSCESTLQHKPNFPLFTETLKISNSQREQRSHLHFESISHLQYNDTTLPKTCSTEDACVFFSLDRNATRISAILPKSTPTDVDC